MWRLPARPARPGDLGASSVGSATVYALVVSVFVLDLNTRLGLAVGMLYVPLVLLAFFVATPRQVALISALGVALTVVGALLSPPAAEVLAVEHVWTNRLLAVLGIVACGWFGVAMLQGRLDLERSNRDLRSVRDALTRQTRLLEIAGEVGRFGGWSVDVPDGVVHWSDEVARIHGEPPGTHPSVDGGIHYYLPEDRPRLRAAFDACVHGGTSFDLEAQIRRADGEVRWVNATGRPERDATGAVIRIQGSFQDVTDRIEAQLEARSSRGALAALSEAMPFIMWTATPAGEIDYVSQELWRYAGVLTQDALGDAWLEVLHPDDRAPTLDRWADSLESGEPYTVHFRLRRSDGAYRWHLVRATPERDATGAIVKWWGSSTDVHDLRELEARARELARRLEETLESIGDAVLALDSSWRMTFVNQQAEHLLGTTRERIAGKVIWDVFPEARGTIFQEQYERAVAEQRPARFDAPFEPLGIHADVAAYPHQHGLTVYFRDVSEQRAMAAQLAHAQKLESVGQLTGGIAHDFNNLLTVILGSAEVLAATLEDDRSRHLAETIRTTAERGSDLTHNLLAFARRQPLAPEPVDVSDLVLGMHDLLSRSLGAGIELRSGLAEDLPPCRVDRGQLENALLNLCLNARDAMGGSGRLTVTTSRAELDEQYAAHHADVVPGDYVCVSVADQGPGVDPEDLDRIFEPFFTTKEVGRGSGLGLAMVYGLMKQSRGHVSVHSEEGCGATFTLYLPVEPDHATQAVPSAEGPSAEDPAVPEPAGNGESVLLVEDDESVRRVAATHLVSLGYDVTTAPDGASALAALSSDAHVDLLLTDVVMPGGLHGPDLVDRALAVRPRLRVLYTSGYTDGAELTGPDGRGAPLLTKPYGRTDLARAVRAALLPAEGARSR
jgi:PAS domain S-box-containing protein